MKMERHSRKAIFNPEAHVDYTLAHQVITVKPIKNQVHAWTFKMVDATDYATPETGRTVTVEISQDGGAFTSLAGSPAINEIGSGWYEVDVAATDMNYDVVLLKAIATGAAQTDEVFYPM